MAYRIQYSQEMAYRYPQQRTRKKIKPGKWIGLAVLVVALAFMRIYGIPDFLIPGDPAVTKTAVTALIGDIREGSAVNEAITVFCETILHGAGF